jgi:hypothetical protein
MYGEGNDDLDGNDYQNEDSPERDGDQNYDATFNDRDEESRYGQTKQTAGLNELNRGVDDSPEKGKERPSFLPDPRKNENGITLRNENTVSVAMRVLNMSEEEKS